MRKTGVYVLAMILLAVLAHIGETAHRYRSSFERNFVVWDILNVYVWPNPPEVVAIRTYIGQAEYLTDWLQARIAWLDGYLNRPNQT